VPASLGPHEFNHDETAQLVQGEQADASTRVLPIPVLVSDHQQVIAEHLDVIAEDMLQARAFLNFQVGEGDRLALHQGLACHLEQRHHYPRSARRRASLPRARQRGPARRIADAQRKVGAAGIIGRVAMIAPSTASPRSPSLLDHRHA